MPPVYPPDYALVERAAKAAGLIRWDVPATWAYGALRLPSGRYWNPLLPDRSDAFDLILALHATLIRHPDCIVAATYRHRVIVNIDITFDPVTAACRALVLLAERLYLELESTRCVPVPTSPSTPALPGPATPAPFSGPSLPPLGESFSADSVALTSTVTTSPSPPSPPPVPSDSKSG